MTHPDLSPALRALLEAALDVRKPTPRLVRAVNRVLDVTGHALSTNRRKGERDAA